MNSNGALALTLAIFGHEWSIENPDGTIDYRFKVSEDGTVTETTTVED